MSATTGLRHAAALTITLYCLGASGAFALEGGRYGQIKVVQPPGPARGLVIFFSDRHGFTKANAAAAEDLAKDGALVAEIDTAAYLSRLDKSKEDCHQLVSEAEWLSRALQRQYHFRNYQSPVLAGIGEGGTLAELTLTEAPAATIAGVVSLDPVATVGTRRPVCTAVSIAGGPAGFRYGPPKKLPGYWTVGLMPGVSKANRDYIMALQHAGAPCEVREISPKLTKGEALRSLIPRHIATARKSAGEISALPLIELPVEHSSELMAVVLSGDGGWRDLDKTIAEDLQRRGVPVVGWDSLRYFWSKKTPEQTATDLGAVIETFMEKWHADKVALIGYSFGADVLPFAYNRLPVSLRSHVALIALLALSKSADFEITIAGWLGEPPGADALPVNPEADKIPPPLMQCFYGQGESDTDCPTLGRHGVEIIQTEGGHHFNGDYEALARDILDGFKRRADVSARAGK